MMKSLLSTLLFLTISLPVLAENLKISSGGTVSTKGTAGGSIEASKKRDEFTEGKCEGFISATPNHTLKISKHGVYNISVSGANQLTLVVTGPRENYCGANLVILPSPGVYQIFVGTKNGEKVPYQLKIVDSAG